MLPSAFRLIIASHVDTPNGLRPRLALFAPSTVLVARAPAALSVLFDLDYHIGPAILWDGGARAGVGERW